MLGEFLSWYRQIFIFTDQSCPQHFVKLNINPLKEKILLSAVGVFYKGLNDLNESITMANLPWVKWLRKENILKPTFCGQAGELSE